MAQRPQGVVTVYPEVVDPLGLLEDVCPACMACLEPSISYLQAAAVSIKRGIWMKILRESLSNVAQYLHACPSAG